MDKYKIVAGTFEGPLDLLMHLIEKDKLDIYDIPIASVTQQYLSYISSMQEFNIELASEFLLMAATLLQIKSRMLLPKQPATAPDGEEEDALEDPRQKLVERLIAYRQFKEMGEVFAGLWEKSSLYAVREPMLFATTPSRPKNLSVEQLLVAIAGLMESAEETPTYINNEEINVHDKMDDILQLLKIKGDNLTLRETLIRSGSNIELVSAFLAILELLRLKSIKIRQPEKFGDIYIYLQEGAHVL